MTTNNVNINGPLNIIRLENNKTGKVVYILADNHSSIMNQVKCDDFSALNISQLFEKFFEKTNEYKTEKWDFLLEVRPEELDVNHYGNRVHQNKYIRDLVELFVKYFSFKVNNKKLYVYSSKKYPNIRFHYIDPRFSVINGSEHILTLLNNLNTINNQRLIGWNDSLKYTLDKLINFPKVWLGMINTNKYDKEKANLSEKMLYKLRNVYNEENTKKIVNNIIDTQLMDNYKKLDKLYNDLKKEIDTDYKYETKKYYSSDRVYLKKNKSCGYGVDFMYERIGKMDKKLRKFEAGIIENISCPLVDLYTIRRIVDKEYVKNAVVYTGWYHSLEIIYYLVKYFDFKITHNFYSEKDINELNTYIKKQKGFDFCKDFNALIPEYLTQCSNMKGFPDLFT